MRKECECQSLKGEKKLYSKRNIQIFLKVNAYSRNPRNQNHQIWTQHDQRSWNWFYKFRSKEFETRLTLFLCFISVNLFANWLNLFLAYQGKKTNILVSINFRIPKWHFQDWLNVKKKVKRKFLCEKIINAFYSNNDFK